MFPLVAADATAVNHGDTGDAPAWIDEGDGTRTRYVTGLDGNLAATITHTGTTVTAVRYQLTGLHGDVITTTSPGAATPDGAFLDYDEYGNPRGTTPATRYGWLGGKQRSSDALAGLILMGARLYHPTLGRFLQVDPIPGGNANAYTYPTDPVNLTDLLGTNVVYGSAGRAFLWVRRMGGHWYVNVGFALYSGYYAIWARVVIIYWARNGAGAIWRWYWLGWRRTFERNIRLPDYLGGPVSAFGYILAPGYGWTWWYGWYPVLFYSKFMYDRS